MKEIQRKAKTMLYNKVEMTGQEIPMFERIKCIDDVGSIHINSHMTNTMLKQK